MVDKKSNVAATSKHGGFIVTKTKPRELKVLEDLPDMKDRPNIKLLKKGRSYKLVAFGSDRYFWQDPETGAMFDNDILKRLKSDNLIEVSDDDYALPEKLKVA